MKKVPSEGPRDAKIMVVGESPGGVETRTGRPFVGPTGKSLDKHLKAAGIDRAKCFMTNVCKYEPKGGNKERFFWEGGIVGNPSDPFIEGIVELAQDIKEVKPNVVVALGNYALWALTQEVHISKWRGSVVDSTLVPGTKVIPMYHPSFLFRSPEKAPLLNWDMLRAAREAGYADIRSLEREYILYPTPDQVAEAVERLLSASEFTFDSEWYNSELVSCIGFSDSPDWAICIPADMVGAVEAYNTLLGSSVRKVAQNAMFDVVNLRRAGITVLTEDPESGERLIEDTMVAFSVCWADIGQKGLDTLTSVYTDLPYYKDDLKIWGITGDRTTLFNYNCIDNVATQESWERLRDEELPYCGAERAYELSMSTFNVWAESTAFGVRADVECFVELRAGHVRTANQLEKELQEIVGWPINVRSTKDVGALVYDILGVPERAKRSTKQEILTDICAQADAKGDTETRLLLEAVLRTRQNRNAVSKFMADSVIDPDGRIRFNWNMVGTKQARLSASKTYWGSGLAIQQAPEELRLVFIPDDGHLFVGHDLAQAEARIVAALSEDDQLLEWMDQGIDIHAKLASQFPWGMTYDEVVAEHKGGGSRKRDLSKACRHGLNYMMGYKTFKNTINKKYLDTGLGVTERETKQMRGWYLDLHPNLQHVFWKWITTEVSRNGAITNALGRRKRFIGRWSDAMLREAVSFYPQSTVGDLTHLGVANLRREAPWIRPLINMHDGALYQVPEDRVDEAVEAVREACSIPVVVNRRELVIPVDVKVGPSWGELKEVKE